MDLIPVRISFCNQLAFNPVKNDLIFSDALQSFNQTVVGIALFFSLHQIGGQHHKKTYNLVRSSDWW